MSIEQLDIPADITQWLEDRYITNLMYMIWLSRQDLQHAFDLNTANGQVEFCKWYDVSVTREYGLVTQPSENSVQMASNLQTWLALLSWHVPLHIKLMRLQSIVARVSRYLPLSIRIFGKSIWLRLLVSSARMASRKNLQKLDSANSSPKITRSGGIAGLPGANLIGYAHAELGMGEQLRMCAAAFETTDVNFGVRNFNVGLLSRQQASLDHGQLTTTNIYRTNIFNINADQMLKAYCHLGRDFFAERYNIGYWAWELSTFPQEWVPVMNMVDEIWAFSHFIENALLEKTKKPVKFMPQCVLLPEFPKYNRTHFGLPEDSFLFLFTFDFFSYIDRKNPFASILAFKKAFPNPSERVSLVIKAMNGDAKNPHWIRMLEMTKDDPRIHIFNQTMNRSDVLGLIDVCDCFVSLHRSEGFGRGPAEAMYLGKPVIVTNYSGNTDFTLSDNSCLVDYQLIPVEPGQYLYGEGQVWADADVEHAAWYMRKLVNDISYAKQIGTNGSEFVRTNFSPSAIGELYKKRLQAIGLI